MDPIENFREPELVMGVTTAGAELWACMVEAFQISLSEEMPVVFTHNERRYRVNGAAAMKDYLRLLEPLK